MNTNRAGRRMPSIQIQDSLGSPSASQDFLEPVATERPYQGLVILSWFKVHTLVPRLLKEWSKYIFSWIRGFQADISDDLESAILALEDVRRAELPISVVKSLEWIVSEIIKYKDGAVSYWDKWRDMMSDLDSIRTLLLDYYQDLNDTQRYTQIPDHSEQAIRTLISTLAQVIPTLRHSLKLRRQYRMFAKIYCRSLLGDIENCGNDIKMLLDLLSTSIAPKTVYEAAIDLQAQVTMVLDMTSSATPCRYRLLDCNKFVQHNIIRITEFTDFPHVGYSAISYVWRGNHVDPSSVGSKLIVAGAEDADPISVDVLKHACTASLKRGFAYLWIDRLCIMQTSRDDKKWQISHMYRIYQSSNLCIVLPGGLQCLVRLDEETSWIHRGWTLQEVLAPTSVVVLFAWQLGPGQGFCGNGANGAVEEVILGHSAMASLPLVLDASTVGSMYFAGHWPDRLHVMTTIFGAQPANYSWNNIPLWGPQRKIISPNVAALIVAMSKVLSDDEDSDTRNYAIWQSALMRTSSRPVDMVFSIMGLFGVTLDTRAYNKNDRLGATIALAKEILKKGGRASWIGTSFRLEPSRQLSTFSVFPQTRVSGKALVKTKAGVQEVSEQVDSVYPNPRALMPLPQGSMDDAGYFVFSRKAVQVIRAIRGMKQSIQYDDALKPTLMRATDGSLWKVRRQTQYTSENKHGETQSLRAFAVLLGWFDQYYPGATPAHDADNIRAMLVEEHAPNKFHLRSFFCLSMKAKEWVTTWEECAFSVGGPDVHSPEQGGVGPEDNGELHETSMVNDIYRPIPVSRTVRGVVTLKEEAMRDSRWAVEQRILERKYTGLPSTDKSR